MQKFRRIVRKRKTELTAACLLLLLSLAMAFAGSWFYRQYRKQVIQTEESQLLTMAGIIGNNLNTYLDEQLKQIDLFYAQEADSENNMPPEDIETRTAYFLKENGGLYNWITVTESDGTSLRYEPGKEAVREQAEEAIRQGKNQLPDQPSRIFGKAISGQTGWYELYIRTTKRGQKAFVLDIDQVTADTLRDIWEFLENEYRYCALYPEIYEAIPEARTPQPRGKNTLLDCFSRIRTFFYWCNSNKKTRNRPFDDFPLEECTYGTPYYITVEELHKIYGTNLMRHPQLAVQRDIFVFQCLIGCRVGDLLKMTKSNLIDGAIEYIPRKTKEGRPLTVRVPLNQTAKEIVSRYKSLDGDKLLPFISEQKYNLAIKRIFKAAGLKRLVTVINPTTREEEKRVLYEIASSHLARRTFVGNLYKQVKDPNLVGALSGHKEGSKAFARYRTIDDEMKKELVNLLS